MKVSASTKVLAVLCIAFVCIACDLNVDNVTPPAWIQGTWVGTTHTFTFTTHDIVQTSSGSEGSFTASTSDVTLEDFKDTTDTYQVELSKDEGEEKHKFVLIISEPDTIEYFHTTTDAFPDDPTDTLHR